MSVRNKQRVVSALVVVGSAIAACLVAPDLSSSEQAQIMVASGQNPYNFGLVPLNTTAISDPIVITSAGWIDDDTIVSFNEGCFDFELVTPLPIGARICGGGAIDIASGAQPCATTTSFQARFTPNGTIESSCQVAIHFMTATFGSGSAFVTLNGQGLAPPYDMTLQPTPIDFNDVPINQDSSARAVTLVNTGTTPMTVTGSINNSRFRLSGSNPPLTAHQLEPGPSKAETYNIVCHPGDSDTNPFTGSLTFTTSSLEGQLSQTAVFDCRGIVSQLSIVPSPASFPSTLVGVPPIDLMITITNPSTISTTVGASLDLGDLNPELTLVSVTPSVPRTLGQGQSVVARLHYAAASEHPSGSLGRLVVSAGLESPRNVGIDGEALTGLIGTTPPEVDFGPVCGGDNPSKNVIVYAQASGALELISVTSPGAPFSVTDMSGTLAANHGPGVTLTAGVTAAGAGDFEDTFTLNSTSPSEPGHPVKMKATVLSSGVAATPNLVHFDTGQLNVPVLRSVVISNCESGEISIIGAHIEGANAAEFTIADPPDPTTTLAKAGTTKLLLLMTPRTKGPKAARLIVDYEGGQVIAALDGNGAGGDRETYYACSSSRPGAVWPIALALVLLHRRRRRARR